MSPTKKKGAASSTPYVYSFGYWGWGRAGKKLITLADEHEASQGRRPPIWVDARVRREARAPDFRGDAFERLVGKERYHWLQGLGNQAIKEGGEMRLADPTDVDVLLDLVVDAHAAKTRVIFYCACEWIRAEGERFCHRDLVTETLLKRARARGQKLTAAEWLVDAGAGLHQVSVDDRDIRHWSQGWVLPRAGDIADLPLLMAPGTAIVLNGDATRDVAVLRGPAYHNGAWRYDVFFWLGSLTDRQIPTRQRAVQKSYGYIERSV